MKPMSKIKKLEAIDDVLDCAIKLGTWNHENVLNMVRPLLEMYGTADPDIIQLVDDLEKVGIPPPSDQSTDQERFALDPIKFRSDMSAKARFLSDKFSPRHESVGKIVAKLVNLYSKEDPEVKALLKWLGAKKKELKEKEEEDVIIKVKGGKPAGTGPEEKKLREATKLLGEVVYEILKYGWSDVVAAGKIDKFLLLHEVELPEHAHIIKENRGNKEIVIPADVSPAGSAAWLALQKIALKRIETEKSPATYKPHKAAPPCHDKPSLVISDGKLRVYANGWNRGGSGGMAVHLVIDLTGGSDRRKLRACGREDTALKSFIDKYASPGPPTMSVDWPDMGVPAFDKSFWEGLVSFLKEKASVCEDTEYIVLICCAGGHGRTGTCMAIFGELFGLVPGDTDAVTWIRKVHCDKAVETEGQITYVEKMAGVTIPQEVTAAKEWTQSSWSKEHGFTGAGSSSIIIGGAASTSKKATEPTVQ